MPRPRRTVILKHLPAEQKVFHTLSRVLMQVYEMSEQEARLRARRSYGIVALDERPDYVDALEAALLAEKLEAYILPADWVPDEPEQYQPCRTAWVEDDGLRYLRTSEDETAEGPHGVKWEDVGAVGVGAVLFEEIKGLGKVRPGSFLGSVGGHVAEISNAINPSATAFLKAKIGDAAFDKALSWERAKDIERAEAEQKTKNFQEVAALRLRNPEAGLYIFPREFAAPGVDKGSNLPPIDSLRQFLEAVTGHITPLAVEQNAAVFLKDATEAFPAYHSPHLFQRVLRWQFLRRLVAPYDGGEAAGKA